MSLVHRTLSRAWVVVPLLACALIIWIASRRAARVEHVSSLGLPPAGPVATDDTASSRGFRPALIVPERHEASFDLMTRVEEMFSLGEWRVRRTDADNAPFGRDVHATSPDAWCYALTAWIDHALSGRPIAAGVERTAIFFAPMLHVLLLVATVVLVAWRFGAFAAALASIGIAAIYPLSASFLPGVPDGEGLARAIAFGSVLLLLAGMRDRRRSSTWLAAAGVGGGIAMWIDAQVALLFLGGAAAGGFGAAALQRRRRVAAADDVAPDPAWRVWALAGAATVLAGYLVEYAPGQLAGWRMGQIHPIYAVAWIGAAEVIRSIGGSDARRWSLGRTAVLVIGAAAAAAPAAIVWSGAGEWPSADISKFQLTLEPAGVIAANLWSWLGRDGVDGAVVAALLPFTIVAGAWWLLVRRATPPGSREVIVCASGPVLVTLAVAARHLGTWPAADLALVLLLVAASSSTSTKLGRIGWAGVVAACGIAGLVKSAPPRPGAAVVLTANEAQEVVERDLARWLAEHASEPRPVVFAPPSETTTLCFHGGLRGVGTLAPDNRSGFEATLMLTAAATMEEAQAALQARGVRYLVIPSWDPFFDDFAARYLAGKFAGRRSLLVDELRRWHLPGWLRPLAYQMPVIGGFEKASVLVFEVVDDQSPPAAAGRLTEYLIETGRIEQAGASGAALRRFPADAGALVAEAQLLQAQGETEKFGAVIATLRTRIATGADRYLPWDRRVSLAATLAQGGQLEPARKQLRLCLDGVTEKRLRALSPGSLYRLLVLTRALAMEIADPRARALAWELLPPELRAQL
ncbi:MAG TPA: hypothetical protein VG710_12655 [Opitutus sp.]|nr:hypothetical protein [Opitutus sp.]